MVFRTLAGSIGVLAAFVACGGASKTPAPQPTVCSDAATVPAPDQVIYPAPGATGVPDGNFTVVLEFPISPVYIVAGNANSTPAPGATALSATPVPSPLPSPAAPAGDSSGWAGYAVGPLTPATTYQTVVYEVTSDACGASIPVSAGSFTTQ